VASRPFSWINTALPFVAAAFGAAGRIDAAILVGFLYFLFPYNLLMYGVNDLYDYESDIRNPRKASIEGGLVPPTSGHRLWLAVAATNLPVLALIGWLAGPVAGFACAATALTAWLYSAPPLRTKERPFLDSVTSALHFALPAVCGFLVAGVPIDAIPWPIIAGFVAWGIASHALGAIQDIVYDRAAGIGSIATALGARATAWVSLAGYGVAVAVAVSYGPAGLFAAAWLALYVLLPLMVLAHPGEPAARRAWRGFLGLNLLVGFVLTQELLRIWGITSFTGPELAVALAAGAAGVALLMISSTRFLVPRPAVGLASADAAAVTVVIPARDEADRLPGALTSVLAQDGVSRILVVDDGSTDGTATIARSMLGERGEVIAAAPLPPGWAGKSWAAWTGIRHAATELVLVLDADTVLAPGAVRALATEAARSGADLVSGVTRYAMATQTEGVLMPGFPMLLFGFLPLGLLARTGGRPSALAFAYGPLMLLRRDAYLETGGHAAIAGSAREDVDLARLFARARRRIALVQAADLGATRHYASAGAIARAWRRILFAYTGESLPLSITELLGFGLAWVLPMLVPLAGLVTGDPVLVAGGAFALGLMVAARIVLAVTQRMPLSTVLWHPVTAPATLALQVIGLLADILGGPRAWHGRALPSTATRPAAATPVTSGSTRATNRMS
jgi:4-hydroxybenzoate polyprenyltransferase